MSSSTRTQAPEHAPDQETNIGLAEDEAAALTYVLGLITGIVMYLVESDNETVQFHAVQSIVVFGGLFVASIAISALQMVLSAIAVGPIGLIVGLLSMVLSLVSLAIMVGGFVAWLYLIVRTYQGDDPRVPFAAGIADDYSL